MRQTNKNKVKDWYEKLTVSEQSLLNMNLTLEEMFAVAEYQTPRPKTYKKRVKVEKGYSQQVLEKKIKEDPYII